MRDPQNIITGLYILSMEHFMFFRFYKVSFTILLHSHTLISLIFCSYKQLFSIKTKKEESVAVLAAL